MLVDQVRRDFMDGKYRIVECIKLVRDIRRSSLREAKKEVDGWLLDRTLANEKDYRLDMSKTYALEGFLPEGTDPPKKAHAVNGKSIIAYHWRKHPHAAKMLLELARLGWIKPAEIVFPVKDEDDSQPEPAPADPAPSG